MTLSVTEYLDIRNNCSSDDERQQQAVEYNKELVNTYPFLMPRDCMGDVLANYDYKWTMMDDMPDGWRISFGQSILEEIREELIRCNYLEEYQLLDIKEKWGELRWYDAGIPTGLFDTNDGSKMDCQIWNIIEKYMERSRLVCIECGEKASYISNGWVAPYCEKCAYAAYDKYLGHFDDSDYVPSEFERLYTKVL